MDTNFYQLKNEKGLKIEFSALGGRINSVKIPDKESFTEIAVGYDSFNEMLENDVYIGAICGRFANRISKGKFKIDEKEYQLAVNNGENHIHGGEKGFHTKLWNVEKVYLSNYVSTYKLSLESPDGDENYPGNLNITIYYALNNFNELLIDIFAKTDKPTPVNITTHPYFNLNGIGNGNILNHLLEINSSEFTPLNEKGVPSGEIRKVKNTIMDFSIQKQIVTANNSDYEQIMLTGGIDHNWVLNKKPYDLDFAARLTEPVSGRIIEVYTTQPGLQVYTGIHFKEQLGGRNGKLYNQFCGVALEPQNFPDAPNKPNFPKSILYPKENYHQTIIYKFIC